MLTEGRHGRAVDRAAQDAATHPAERDRLTELVNPDPHDPPRSASDRSRNVTLTPGDVRRDVRRARRSSSRSSATTWRSAGTIASACDNRHDRLKVKTILKKPARQRAQCSRRRGPSWWSRASSPAGCARGARHGIGIEPTDLPVIFDMFSADRRLSDAALGGVCLGPRLHIREAAGRPPSAAPSRSKALRGIGSTFTVTAPISGLSGRAGVSKRLRDGP